MNIFKKNGELSKRCETTILRIYDRILNLKTSGYDFKNKIKFYGKWWRNKGRNLDDSAYRQLRELLWVIGDGYDFGNDAKYGGKEGDFIVLSDKMDEFVKWAFENSKKSSEFLIMFKTYLKIKLL